MVSEAERLAAARAAVADAGIAQRAIACMDLTALGDDESEASAEALLARARTAGVAAVCLWPRFVPLAKAALDGSGVRVATVANFPDGGDDLGCAAEETAAAFAAGADEVDVVAPLEALQEGDVGLVAELVGLCRAVAPPDGTLKLILETGLLQDPPLITAAARSAVMAGIDMLKTSTGKVPIGATPEHAAVLLDVIAEADGRVGLKVSGGIRTADQAAGYLALCDATLGPDWANPRTFRIGASSLLDALLARR
ncbi:MAG: deoxyribose-phosphate aldolase [Pseudomonadota bacterium]